MLSHSPSPKNRQISDSDNDDDDINDYNNDDKNRIMIVKIAFKIMMIFIKLIVIMMIIARIIMVTVILTMNQKYFKVMQKILRKHLQARQYYFCLLTFKKRICRQGRNTVLIFVRIFLLSVCARVCMYVCVLQTSFSTQRNVKQIASARMCLK